MLPRPKIINVYYSNVNRSSYLEASLLKGKSKAGATV